MARKKKPLTDRHRKLACNIRKGMTIKDAGLAAGFATKQAAHQAYKIIKLRFHPALEAAGYNIDQEVTEIYAKLKEKRECKETVFFQNAGIVMETREIIPHAEQRAAANDCARFLGIIGNGHDPKDDDSGLRVPHVSVTVVLDQSEDSRSIVVPRPARAAAREQPVLDVESDTHARSPGPKPEL